MATGQGAGSASRRQGRRWRFGSVVLDERSWTLSVGGAAMAIEAKPLELLHELLLRAGEAVSKDDLLDAVWPDVSVVEASLTTAVLKLRRALGEYGGAIETVPRVGYRLGVPVELDAGEPAPKAADPPSPARRVRRWPAIAAGAVLAVAVLGLAVQPFRQILPARAAPAFTQRDAADALRRLDVDKLEKLLHAGWDPNTAFDDEGNGAINVALQICEWNPEHDRQKLVLVVRTLIQGGAHVEKRNTWGDTAYSIARAKRYCGPDHPVTRMIRTACYENLNPLGDKCLAAYAHPGGDGRKP